MASCHTHFALWTFSSWCSGLRCTNRDSIAIFLQVSWEFGCVSPPTEFTEVWLRKSSHRFHGFAQMAWLRLFSHGFHGIHRSFVASVLPHKYILDSGGCVGMAGCHTLLICAHPCQSVGGTSLPEGSVCSAFCGRYFSTRRVSSVGDYSFSMRKRLTMPKTRA